MLDNDEMNYKRKNNLGRRRRKQRYIGWLGRKSAKRDYQLKQEFYRSLKKR